MPTHPPRACARCGVAFPGAHCPTCGTRDRWRGSARARGYTAAWDRYARRFRARFPFCGQRADGQFHVEHSACARAVRWQLGDVVDHIQPLEAGGPMWDPSNHQTLCTECHNRKTGSARG